MTVRRTVNNERKERVIIDIYGLNQITVSNVFLLLLESKIIVLIKHLKFIITTDYILFFY